MTKWEGKIIQNFINFGVSHSSKDGQSLDWLCLQGVFKQRREIYLYNFLYLYLVSSVY